MPGNPAMPRWRWLIREDDSDSTALDAARLYPDMPETARMLFFLVRYEELIPGAAR